MTSALPLLLGVAMDGALGEPRRWHPLIGFGCWASRLEKSLNGRRHTFAQRLVGLLAWTLAVAPPVALAVWLRRYPMGWLVDAALLYFALGARSLAEHARPIAENLESGHLAEARAALSLIVSRETHSLSATGIAAATVESVLENGNDAIFGTLFWFAALGGPGALLFRLANTLDAMWGYRTPRLRAFGWAAARIDDALNYVPARLTAASYALLGRTRSALACWRTQAPLWDSPNAGPVMASGAGALGVLLGGAATYDGILEARPTLGCGSSPEASDIRRALRLVRATNLMWIAVIGGAAAISWVLP
jgi:adenosylcobinamide-phosphate synthase